MSLEDWLLEVWYGQRRAGWLAPLGWLGRGVSALRARRLRSGLAPRCRLPVPVIVVGNITAGGTGKTPLVLWLARLAAGAGLRPGILCRGYRGRARDWPRRVAPGSDPREVGDEAVLLARRSGVPVVAGPDRCAAGELLVAGGVDLVISDDGLQHLRLERDLEIAVVDRERGLGNERFIPAGPLREDPERLETVDFVVVNGGAHERWPDALVMRVDGAELRALTDERTLALTALAGQRLHAVAGIGNPGRFFALLRRHGLEVIEHRFGDHVSYRASDVYFDDDLPVVMTEKDAVKIAPFATAKMWYLPVEAALSSDATRRLRARVLALAGAAP